MIRRFNKNDIDEVMKIWLNSNVQAHSFINKSYWEENYPMVKEMIPQAEVYIYEEENKICGFIGLAENYIAGIFVDEKFRGKRIGQKLLNYAKEIKEELTLQVYEKNTGAVRFYKREKFIIKTAQEDETAGEKEFFMIWGK